MHTSLATLPTGESRIPANSITPCTECGHMTRSTRMKLSDYPNTIARGGRGMCVTCWRNNKGVQGSLSTPERVQQHRYNVSGLESFMEARRRRGVPTEGLRNECRLDDAA